jgi:hypothetical protein
MLGGKASEPVVHGLMHEAVRRQRLGAGVGQCHHMAGAS